MGENDTETENRILYLYGESSSVEGYISTFRDIAIKHIFLSRFHKHQSSSKKAIHYALNSLRLAQIVGGAHEIRRARMLLLILRLSRIGNFFIG